MDEPQSKPVDSLGIAHVAKSVTTLAKAVNDLQQQMKTLEERISDQEASSSFVNDRNAGQKKGEFIRAYNAVISLMKALRIMPEMKDSITNKGNGTRDVPEQQPLNAPFDKSAQLLRTIALTLSDMETVASYVSQDEVSCAEASNFSRPADFVKIERSDSPNEIEERSSRSKEMDAFKDFLISKDEKIQALVMETKLQTQLLDKKNSRWIRLQLFCIILLLGIMQKGFLSDILSDKISEQMNVNLADKSKEEVSMNESELNFVDELQPESIEDKRYTDGYATGHAPQDPISALNNCLIPPEIEGEKEDTFHEAIQGSIQVPVIEAENEIASYETIQVETNIFTVNEIDDVVPKVQDAIIEPEDTTIQNHRNKENTKEENTRHVITSERSWLEHNLCEEFSDMMQCVEKKIFVNHKERLGQTQTKGVQSVQKVMIRRQILTAIGVAAAMTLPKIAPHIFKINLAQVLSLSFWRSIMEFITVLIQ